MAVLVIAGLDGGGGAGLKADIETVSALGEHPLPVLTAVTYQNPEEVRGYYPLPPDVVRRQIEAVKGYFDIKVVKIGMLGSGEVGRAVAEETRGFTRILDPVMRSSTGAELVDDAEVLNNLVKGSIVTPNVQEAEALSGLEIRSLGDIKESARLIAEELKG